MHVGALHGSARALSEPVDHRLDDEAADVLPGRVQRRDGRLGVLRDLVVVGDDREVAGDGPAMIACTLLQQHRLRIGVDEKGGRRRRAAAFQQFDDLRLSCRRVDRVEGRVQVDVDGALESELGDRAGPPATQLPGGRGARRGQDADAVMSEAREVVGGEGPAEDVVGRHPLEACQCERRRRAPLGQHDGQGQGLQPLQQGLPIGAQGLRRGDEAVEAPRLDQRRDLPPLVVDGVTRTAQNELHPVLGRCGAGSQDDLRPVVRQ